MARGCLIDGGRVFDDTRFPRDGGSGRSGHGRAAGASLLALAGFVGLPLLAAVAGAATSGGVGRAWYLSVAHPPLSLPCALFAPVWAAASLPAGLAAWLVWRARTVPPAARRVVRWPLRQSLLRQSLLRQSLLRRRLLRRSLLRRSFTRGLQPLRLWGWQVLIGSVWMPLLFVGHAPAWALLGGVLPALLLLVACIVAFREGSAMAGPLLLPSVVLMCYAAYLAAGMWWLAALR